MLSPLNKSTKSFDLNPVENQKKYLERQVKCQIENLHNLVSLYDQLMID